MTPVYQSTSAYKVAVKRCVSSKAIRFPSEHDIISTGEKYVFNFYFIQRSYGFITDEDDYDVWTCHAKTPRFRPYLRVIDDFRGVLKTFRTVALLLSPPLFGHRVFLHTYTQYRAAYARSKESDLRAHVNRPPPHFSISLLTASAVLIIYIYTRLVNMY